MSPERVRELLEAVQSGATSVDSAAAALRRLPFTDIDFARVDHHRGLRQAVPEVIFGLGKTTDQIVGVARELIEAGQNVLITRLEPGAAGPVLRELPELDYSEVSRTASLLVRAAEWSDPRPIAVVTAGTGDIPVAEEAAETLRLCGRTPLRVFDVGVAGVHRLLPSIEDLGRCSAVIVVAGMEGALASVVGGLVAVPVIAVPTSVGYGAALSGFTALMGMLTSCAAGVTVVNIDNGFGAAMAAVRMCCSVRDSGEAGG